MLKQMMPKLFCSIFFKLMVVIFVTGMGINLSIVFFFGALRHHITSSYPPHINRYVDYLLKDIGDPPDQIRARQIANATNMIITYESKRQKWRTSEKPIEFPADRLRIKHEEKHLKAGSYRGSFMIKVRHGDGQMTFLLTHLPDAEKKIHFLGLCLLVFITIMMVGAYLAIRWVLKPLRWLKQGVEHVARGELSYQVPERRSDELRDLSSSFNTMTKRLQHLIKSKEQLLLDVSHELRTPITRMKVALAMIADSSNRKSIQEDLKEMEKKITELLETARALNIKASLNYAEVNMVHLIRQTAKMFETTGHPTITFTAMPKSAIIRIDADRIRQVLKNIFENGQKYSPDDAAPIEVSLAVDKNAQTISVKDDGIGIPQKDLDFIFEPFYRADKARSPKKDGFGLGLSLAANIVKAHGGEITINSKLDHGTSVEIRLPCHTDNQNHS